MIYHDSSLPEIPRAWLQEIIAVNKMKLKWNVNRSSCMSVMLSPTCRGRYSSEFMVRKFYMKSCRYVGFRDFIYSWLPSVLKYIPKCFWLCKVSVCSKTISIISLYIPARKQVTDRLHKVTKIKQNKNWRLNITFKSDNHLYTVS